MNHHNPLLIFDLGNVIIRHSEPVLFANISAACDDPAKARPLLDEVFAIGGADLQPTRHFFEGIRERIGFSKSYDDFEKLWSSHFTRDEDMEALVRSLAARYRLVILSNTNDAHWRFLRCEYDIMQVPHALYTSFELGMEKPSADIYRHVLKAESRTPEDSIFIDDRMVNVEAARALGLHGIHFTGKDALIPELERLGVRL
jgi:putative hydrolase of the HAD superfamily